MITPAAIILAAIGLLGVFVLGFVLRGHVERVRSRELLVLVSAAVCAIVRRGDNALQALQESHQRQLEEAGKKIESGG